MRTDTRWHNRLLARAAVIALPAVVGLSAGVVPAGAVAGGAVSVAPGSQNALVGTTATVIANETLGGAAVPGDVITFLVTAGPNAGRSGTATTPNAGFSYVSNGILGTDTVQACAPGATCGFASVAWRADSFSNLGSYGVPPITYAPDNSRTEINNYGDYNTTVIDEGGYDEPYFYDEPYYYDDWGPRNDRWHGDGWDDGWQDDWDW